MIKKINAIKKVQKDIDNQSLSNGKAVQSQPKFVAIATQKKGMPWDLVKTKYVAIAPKNKKGKYWFLFKLLMYFLLLNISIEIFKTIFIPNAICGGGYGHLSEAKQYVGSMNRVQQAYLAENGRFANSIDAFGLGIFKTETNNFHYSVIGTKTAVFTYGIPYKDFSETVYFGLFSWSKNIEAKGYVGAVFIVPATNVNPKETYDLKTVSIICVTKSPTKIQPPNPIFKKGVPTCGDGTEPVTK